MNRTKSGVTKIKAKLPAKPAPPSNGAAATAVTGAAVRAL